ncbi:MAG: GWxTD domain-containing protein [Acidobacteriota bacterium]
MWHLTAALLLALAAGPPVEGKPGPLWHEGPVRYLLTTEEERQFRRLESASEIQAFITRFWHRRDPSPDTPANEFRETFRHRVKASIQLFTQSTKPGWKTDQGKIYILLGPPDEIASSPLQADRRGLTSWLYRHTPRRDVGPSIVVRFSEDSSGEYRLAPDAFADSRFVQLSLAGALSTVPPDFPIPGESSGMESRLQLSRLQNVPFLLAPPRVNVRWSLHGHPFRCCASYFLSQDGSTLVALTFEVDPAFLREGMGTRLSGLRTLGHLARLDGPGRHDLGVLTAQRLRPDPDSQVPLRYQTLRSLEPGRYRAYFALVDDRERLRGSYHEEFEVPKLGTQGLSLSSMTLVEELREVTPADSKPRLEPFLLGHLRVVPRCQPVFAAGEMLGLYYQIYEAAETPSGEPRALEIEYRFQLLMDGQRYQVGPPLRLTGQRHRVQGQVFHLEGWPPGHYRVSLTVRDPAAGKRAEGEALFEIR